MSMRLIFYNGYIDSFSTLGMEIDIFFNQALKLNTTNSIKSNYCNLGCKS